MKRMIACAAATLLLTATGVFAQAAMSPGATTMKSTAPKADASGMKADANASANASASGNADAAAKPKAHRRMAKNEAALNASEAQITRQLNMEQAQQASGAR